VVAFALNVTPHEIVHAITSYLLGFNSTVFQMWVNPDSAEAMPRQLAIITVSGPLFSLAVGARMLDALPTTVWRQTVRAHVPAATAN
jgi:hypothetical protein